VSKWDRERLKSRAIHLADEREPVIPPRIADAETAVIVGQQACVEKVGVRSRGLWAAGLMLSPTINSQRECKIGQDPLLIVAARPGISHDPAIRIDESCEALATPSDRQEK